MKIKAKIDRMVNSGNVKAIASISLDGMFVVKNLKIMDGKKGLFVSMPQETYSGKDGQKKYSNLFFALTNSAKLELQETVLRHTSSRSIPTTHQSRAMRNRGFCRKSSTSGSIIPSLHTPNPSTRTGE